MAYNAINPHLFNAAVAGFVSGALSGRAITDSVVADYNTLQLAAAAFAQEVDSQLLIDSAGVPIPAAQTVGAAQGISVVGPPNTSIVTDTSPAEEAILGKTHLMTAICQAVMVGRYTVDATPGDYAVAARAAAAAYVSTAAALQFP